MSSAQNSSSYWIPNFSESEINSYAALVLKIPRKG
jgi:hypothetical protein